MGLTWSDLSRRIVAGDGLISYDPSPGGSPQAREAVESYYRGRDLSARADRTVLTSSTSEAYGRLLMLLAGPERRLLLPSPGYPLCRDIARFNGWQVGTYRLCSSQHAWRFERKDIAHGLATGAKVVMAIHSHNPTGAYFTVEDQRWLQAACTDAGAVLR